MALESKIKECRDSNSGLSLECEVNRDGHLDLHRLTVETCRLELPQTHGIDRGLIELGDRATYLCLDHHTLLPDYDFQNDDSLYSSGFRLVRIHRPYIDYLDGCPYGPAHSDSLPGRAIDCV